jgi:hypothetical protein
VADHHSFVDDRPPALLDYADKTGFIDISFSKCP